MYCDYSNVLLCFVVHYLQHWSQREHHIPTASGYCSSLKIHILTTCYFGVRVLPEVRIQHSITDLVANFICGEKQRQV